AIGGTVSIVGTDVIFTPTPDYNGPASFVYTLVDDGTTNGAADAKTSTATVSFTIDAVNDAPSFVKGGDQAATDESVPLASTITFDGLTGGSRIPFTAYTENGFTVTPVMGRWLQAQLPDAVLGNPVPAVYGDTFTSILEVTRGTGEFFSFTGFDLASWIDPAPPQPVTYTV